MDSAAGTKAIFLYNYETKKFPLDLYASANKLYKYAFWLPDNGCSLLRMTDNAKVGLTGAGSYLKVHYGTYIKYAKKQVTIPIQKLFWR